MVGGTGQGKTAFLNFLANAQKVMNSLDGIKSCNEIHDQKSERNEGGKMASKTFDAKKYQFAIGHGNFTVIDTPGQVDTKGHETDAINFEKIKNTVLQEGGINCIVVVQNGRESRMSAQLKLIYTSLTSILPNAISEQIVVVYTNCERQNHMNFDHSSLNELLGIEHTREIPFIYIDNPFVYVEKA